MITNRFVFNSSVSGIYEKEKEWFITVEGISFSVGENKPNIKAGDRVKVSLDIADNVIALDHHPV